MGRLLPKPAQVLCLCTGMMLFAHHRMLDIVACVQEGWLNASGRLKRGSSDDAVEVAFDRFWVDLGYNSLRPTLGAQALQ